MLSPTMRRSESPENTRILAENVDAARQALGLSIPELARRANLDRTWLWRVLTKGETATADTLAACLTALAAVVSEKNAS